MTVAFLSQNPPCLGCFHPMLLTENGTDPPGIFLISKLQSETANNPKLLIHIFR